MGIPSIILNIVEKINKDTGYSKKVLDNDYYLRKGEIATGGQHLNGLYKNDELKKIIYNIGSFFGRFKEEYYFLNNQLIFIFWEENYYGTERDAFGKLIKMHFDQLTKVYEGKFYFSKNKLLEMEIWDERKYGGKLESNKMKLEKILLDQSEDFKQQLRNTKFI